MKPYLRPAVDTFVFVIPSWSRHSARPMTYFDTSCNSFVNTLLRIGPLLNAFSETDKISTNSTKNK